MKQSEFQPCALCGKGVMHAGSPIFHRVTIEAMGIDLNAVRRQDGLERMMGHPGLAHIMGEDADLAVEMDRLQGLVCLQCAIHGSVAHLAEALAEKKLAKEGAPE